MAYRYQSANSPGVQLSLANQRGQALNNESQALLNTDARNRLAKWKRDRELRELERQAKSTQARGVIESEPYAKTSMEEGFVRDALSSVYNETSYQEALARIARVNEDLAARLPTRYDPAWVNNRRLGSVAHREAQAEEGFKQAGRLAEEIVSGTQNMEQERYRQGEMNDRNAASNASREEAARLRANQTVTTRVGGPGGAGASTFDYETNKKMSNNYIFGVSPDIVLTDFADDPENPTGKSRDFLGSQIARVARDSHSVDFNKFKRTGDVLDKPKSDTFYRSMAQVKVLGGLQLNPRTQQWNQGGQEIIDFRRDLLEQHLPEAITSLPDGPEKTMKKIESFNKAIEYYIQHGRVVGIPEWK